MGNENEPKQNNAAQVLPGEIECVAGMLLTGIGPANLPPMNNPGDGTMPPLNDAGIERTIPCHPECDHIAHIDIAVMDQPGPGGANHDYRIGVYDRRSEACSELGHIFFQCGPVEEEGFNGLTHEILLTIVIDRLRCFQAGPYACLQNRIAQEHCETALAALRQRTELRIARGVEENSLWHGRRLED